MLYIVATPIGNLEDITLRALKILNQVDGVICEDSRRTSILLNHFHINKHLFVLNDYNEARNIPYLIDKLKKGENLSLVSDAGTPLISDPGYKLVREAIRQNVPIDSLPGPSSLITALTLSGLPPDKFFFLGYLPEKPMARVNTLKALIEIDKKLKSTFIIFLPPHKLLKTFIEIKETLGDINLSLAKELTKLHQKIETKKASLWIEDFTATIPKGEFVCLFRI
ncbi:16S rRNA (cytidine(1402)-2'-O)-methyltransferase [Candidatus Daviesbacteria bacterium]|nr:16S rRNA (cytidine(1402)-2'-O)-methyltransferase [Candidatus Daviesbacteria bacterium]